LVEKNTKLIYFFCSHTLYFVINNYLHHLMKMNLANWDRVVRLNVALVLICLFHSSSIDHHLDFSLLFFALYYLVTSYLSYSPVYSLLGFSTRKQSVNE